MKVRITPDLAPVVVRAKAAADQPKWWAYYEASTLTIALDPLASPALQAEYLIHETIHAIWHYEKLPRRMSEETVCTKLGMALAKVLALNPHVVHALVGALHHDKPIVTQGE